MRVLLIHLAKMFNQCWQRTGQVFKRFHERALASPREVP